MAALLRLMAFGWVLLALANFYIVPKIPPTTEVPRLVDPMFNAWIYFGSSIILFIVAFAVTKQTKKYRKPSAGKVIDPKNEIRLRELKALKYRGLVKGAEYRRKREEILKGL